MQGLIEVTSSLEEATKKIGYNMHDCPSGSYGRVAQSSVWTMRAEGRLPNRGQGKCKMVGAKCRTPRQH